MNNYKFIYVDAGTLWFTDARPGDVWGDDWNDAPYEHNAGDPYYWRPERGVPPYRLVRVSADLSLWRTPAERATDLNCELSVEDMNRAVTPSASYSALRS